VQAPIHARAGTGRQRAIARCLPALAFVLSAAAGACTVSEDQEAALGEQTAAEIASQLPIVADPAVTAYLEELGAALAGATERPEIAWRFHLVNSGDVNAFAVPGGYVYVNRGLVERAQSLRELAGVLGHEVNHVALRHSAEQLESQTRTQVGVGLVCALTGWCEGATAQVAINAAGALWFARHSREDEAEADSAAVATLVRAGIDPEGVPAMFARLLEARERQPGPLDAFFASHPLEEARIAATRAHVERLDPAMLEGLVQDTPAFHAWRDRVAALPPPPPAPPQLR
jgi:predicted Zn-dependent protease